MPLYIDQSGDPETAETDLMTFSGYDGGFGDQPGPDPSVLQIVYFQNSLGYSQDRLAALVDVADNIVVTGVDSTFILNGIPIKNIAGATFVNVEGTIRVVYDTTQCDGNGYYVYDTHMNKIVMPGPAIEFHELAHAYHIAIGDLSADPETQAEDDENNFRAQNGLPLRDPTNHGGGCGAATGVNPWSCLIISAACGSPLAPEVARLHRLRELVLRRSPLADALLKRFFEEYYQFSAGVAADMEGSPPLKEAINLLVVAPFCDFWGLLARYAGVEGSRADTGEYAEQVLESARTRMRAAGLDGGAVAEIRAAFAAAVERFREFGGDGMGIAPAPPARVTPRAVLAYLEAAIASAPSTEMVNWALLQPLAAWWNWLDRSARRPPPAPAGTTLAADIDGWLGAVPIPGLAAGMGPQLLGADLAGLATTLLASPAVRAVLTARLLREIGPHVSYDLAAVLRHAGYSPSPAPDGGCPPCPTK